MALTLPEYKATIKEKDKDIDSELLQIRWEHHEEKRKEKLQVLAEVSLSANSQERNQIIEEEKKGVWMVRRSREMSWQREKSRSREGKEVVVMDSAMLDRERKQLEKIKLRQQQEIQQMIEHELKMQGIRERNKAKMRKQRRKEEQRQKEML